MTAKARVSMKPVIRMHAGPTPSAHCRQSNGQTARASREREREVERETTTQRGMKDNAVSGKCFKAQQLIPIFRTCDVRSAEMPAYPDQAGTPQGGGAHCQRPGGLLL